MKLRKTYKYIFLYSSSAPHTVGTYNVGLSMLIQLRNACGRFGKHTCSCLEEIIRRGIPVIDPPDAVTMTEIPGRLLDHDRKRFENIKI